MTFNMNEYIFSHAVRAKESNAWPKHLDKVHISTSPTIPYLDIYSHNVKMIEYIINSANNVTYWVPSTPRALCVLASSSRACFKLVGSSSKLSAADIMCTSALPCVCILFLKRGRQAG